MTYDYRIWICDDIALELSQKTISRPILTKALERHNINIKNAKETITNADKKIHSKASTFENPATIKTKIVNIKTKISKPKKKNHHTTPEHSNHAIAMYAIGLLWLEEFSVERTTIVNLCEDIYDKKDFCPDEAIKACAISLELKFQKLDPKNHINWNNTSIKDIIGPKSHQKLTKHIKKHRNKKYVPWSKKENMETRELIIAGVAVGALALLGAWFYTRQRRTPQVAQKEATPPTPSSERNLVLALLVDAATGMTLSVGENIQREALSEMIRRAKEARCFLRGDEETLEQGLDLIEEPESDMETQYRFVRIALKGNAKIADLKARTSLTREIGTQGGQATIEKVAVVQSSQGWELFASTKDQQ